MQKRIKVSIEDKCDIAFDQTTLSTEAGSGVSIGDSIKKKNASQLTCVPFRGKHLVNVQENEAILGEGAFGQVCRMFSPSENEAYAVKRISFIKKESSEGYYRIQFMREIYVCSYVSGHPNIMKILESSVEKEYGCFVMPLYGKDLSKFISETVVDTHQTMRLMKQLSSAVAHIHGMEIFHRDIKPANIMVTNHGETLILSDFNSACFYIRGRTYTRPMVTLWYRPPEILCDIPSKYDKAVDIWSLGCILGEFMIGKPLFPGDSEIGMLFRIMQMMGTPRQSLYFSKEEGKMFPRFPRGFRVPANERSGEFHSGSLVRILKRTLRFHSKDRPKASELEKLFIV